MLEPYTQFFIYLAAPATGLPELLGQQRDGFLRLLQKQPRAASPRLGIEYENYLRAVIRFGLNQQAMEPRVAEFLRQHDMLRDSVRGPRVYLNPRPSQISLRVKDHREIVKGLTAAKRLERTLGEPETTPRTRRRDVTSKRYLHLDLGLKDGLET